MFSGVYWNQPVCLSIHVSVRVFICVQHSSFCQSAGIKSYLVIALVLRVCSTSLLKTLLEKEKLLVTSNFFFSHSVFYPFGELYANFS